MIRSLVLPQGINLNKIKLRLNADAKSLVDIARIESQNHRFVYNEAMKV